MTLKYLPRACPCATTSHHETQVPAGGCHLSVFSRGGIQASQRPRSFTNWWASWLQTYRGLSILPTCSQTEHHALTTRHIHGRQPHSSWTHRWRSCCCFPLHHFRRVSVALYTQKGGKNWIRWVDWKSIFGEENRKLSTLYQKYMEEPICKTICMPSGNLLSSTGLHLLIWKMVEGGTREWVLPVSIVFHRVGGENQRK